MEEGATDQVYDLLLALQGDSPGDGRDRVLAGDAAGVGEGGEPGGEGALLLGRGGGRGGRGRGPGLGGATPSGAREGVEEGEADEDLGRVNMRRETRLSPVYGLVLRFLAFPRSPGAGRLSGRRGGGGGRGRRGGSTSCPYPSPRSPRWGRWRWWGRCWRRWRSWWRVGAGVGDWPSPWPWSAAPASGESSWNAFASIQV